MAEVGRMRMPWDLWAGDNELGGETMVGGAQDGEAVWG